jgi:glycosyltransferase involved in cell wall biosynthesis
MKVDVMILNLGKQFGGVEKYITQIIENIDSETINLHVCVRKNQLFSKVLNKYYSKSINILELDLNKGNIIKSIFLLCRYLKNNKISVIHNNGITASLFGTISGKIIKVDKVITTIHGFSDDDRMERQKLVKIIFNWLEKILFYFNDNYIAVSFAIKEHLVNKGLNSNKIDVIHHGINLNNHLLEEHDNKSLTGKINICSIGRLEKIKGYEYLIKALKEYLKTEEDNIICNIVGDGSERKNLEKLCEELQIKKNVRFLGYLDNVEQVLKKSDIYVQPSLNEAFGISLLEAMKFGKPVIASEVGGIPEIIKNNKNGLLFKNKDYCELASKIKELVKNDKLRNEIGKEARKSVESNFQIKKSIQRIEEYYLT